MREIGRSVDVETEQGVVTDGDREPEFDGLLQVAAKGAGAVGELERSRSGERRDVGAVAARVGHQGDGADGHGGGKGDSPGEVAVRHYHVLDAALAQVVDAAVDGCVQPDAGMPQDRCAVLYRPLRHRLVVTGDEHRQLAGGGQYAIGGPARQRRAVVRRQRRCQARLRIRECLDRHEYHGVHTGIVEAVAYAVPMPINVAVIGAGSWGTTVAALAAVNTPTLLWARRAELADSINSHHVNPDYLAQFTLPPQLRATSSLEEAVSHADVLVMAVPSHGYREVVAEAAPYLRPWVPVVSLTKGLERGSRKRMSEVTRDEMPGHPVAVLTGPNLAKEILSGQPAASVVAIDEHDIATELQRVFTTPSLRVYTNGDVVGCEVGGVVKNVMAIAAGMAEGMGFGDNTRATLITRGLAEMTRLGIAMGGHASTFAGLAGMGDLIATCSSKQSRNNMVGFELGQGKSIEQVLASMNMVAEGVKSSPSVLDLARRYGVEMPIAEQVVAVCHHGRPAREALGSLMQRTRKSEME